MNSDTETTRFTIEEIGGRDVLRMFYPKLYRKLNPGDANSGEAIFTVVEKDVTINGTPMTVQGIFGGDMQRASQASSIPFTGKLGVGIQVTNTTLLEAALKARGITSPPTASELTHGADAAIKKSPSFGLFFLMRPARAHRWRCKPPLVSGSQRT